jgi:hypothetical protein
MLAEVGIDKKLSARSQKVGSIGEQAFEAVVANVRCRQFNMKDLTRRHGSQLNVVAKNKYN